MFSRVATLSFVLPVLVAATALPRFSGGGGGGSPIPASQCNTGGLQCCNSVQSASTSPVSALLGLLGIVVGDVTGLVGLTCSPINVIGVSGNSCSAQPVCCTDNHFNGLVAIGCTPVNLNL